MEFNAFSTHFKLMGKNRNFLGDFTQMYSFRFLQHVKPKTVLSWELRAIKPKLTFLVFESYTLKTCVFSQTKSFRSLQGMESKSVCSRQYKGMQQADTVKKLNFNFYHNRTRNVGFKLHNSKIPKNTVIQHSSSCFQHVEFKTLFSTLKL